MFEIQVRKLETCSKAYFECLKYARENGGPWDSETCSKAAKYGDLECLKYGHENGCPWDERTCANAAKYGHLECLEYARENGCPLTKRLPPRKSNGARNGTLIPTRSDVKERERDWSAKYSLPRAADVVWKSQRALDFRYFMVRRLGKVKEVKLIKGRE